MRKTSLSITAIALFAAATSSVNAATLAYNETFVGTTVTLNAASLGNTIFSFGNGNAIGAGDYSGVSNNNSFDGTGGTITFGPNNNYRAVGTLISLNNVDAGTYAIDFILSAYDFSPGTGPGYTQGGVWLVEGVTAGVGGGITQNFSSGSPPTGTAFKAPTIDGSATVTGLNTSITLSGTGSNAGNFTLTSSGGANDYLFFQVARDGANSASGHSGGFTLDTIDIFAVPEPSSSTLLGLGIAGLLATRRRR